MCICSYTVYYYHPYEGTVAYQEQYKVRRTIIHLLLYDNITQTICEKNEDETCAVSKKNLIYWVIQDAVHCIAKTSNHSRNPSKGLVTDQECWVVWSVYFSTNTGMENSVLTFWCLATTVWKCINEVHCLRGMPPVTLVPPFQRFSRCAHKTRLGKTLHSS